MGAYDISRVVFDPRKHYASVRMQQGRVMIDDDWNESERIENEERRRSRVDIIGAHGSPDQGFRIENLRTVSGPVAGTNLIEFDIHPGTYHLGGLRLEMENPDPSDPNSRETFRTQRDWLQQPHADAHIPPLTAGEERYDFVYLEAWRQAVSAVEDDELFEKALAGPDTSTRIRTMRRVRLQENIQRDNCPAAWQRLRELWETADRGRINQEHELVTDTRLQVSYAVGASSDDLCSPSIAGGYLGAENQAIRVQLIDGTQLTWGFDNASSLYRVQATAADTIEFLTFPRDQHHWPLAGQVVEILPWSAILPNGEKVATVRGHLSKVASSFDPDDGILTLDTPLPAGFGEEWQDRSDNSDIGNPGNAFFYLRVWNRGADLNSDAAINYTPGSPITLGSTGLEVTITGNGRRSNDYWIIAARPETPDQVTPWSLENGITPHGIRRFYAPLALIHWTVDADGNVVGEIIRDCRKTFRPLTDLETCCTYTVGDGFQSKGDFNSIEEAVAHLPASGGKICVLAGVHEANVRLTDRRQIRISGCGQRSIIRPRLQRVTEPIFSISGSQNIQIDHLSLVTKEGTGIVIEDFSDTAEPSQEIMINDNHILSCVNGIYINVDADRGGDNQFTVLRNKIGMLDKEGGDVAIFCLADGVLIERNDIFVEHDLDSGGGDDPDNPGQPEGNPFDPCAEPELFYLPAFPVARFVFNFFHFARRLFLAIPIVHQYQTKGGIQIGGSSERVRILENKIVGGYGNGITLGHLPRFNPGDFTDDVTAIYNTHLASAYVNNFNRDELAAFVNERFLSTLYEISIENNLIQNMGLSGIGVQSFFNLRETELVISIEDLTIYRNFIRNCARQIPNDVPDDLLDDIGFGGIALADVNEAIIQENRIEDNGLSHADPICGLFILNGEKIDITNNHILNNGPYLAMRTRQIRQGRRGGIIVANSFKQFEELRDPNGNIQPVLFDNAFAIKVHNNVVIQPLGHALLLMAFGPVSVLGNQMSSQGINPRNTLNLMAGTVLILNLGVSKDLITQALLPRFKEISGTRTVNNLAAAPQRNPLQDFLTALQYLPSGRVLFTNNQVTLDLRNEASTIAISSQLIFSLDDVAYNSNQAEISGFLGVTDAGTTTADLVITDALLAGYSVRSNDNRFQEGFALTLYSMMSLGHMNTALGNHSTYCLYLYGTLTPPPVLFDGSNMILRPTLCARDYTVIGRGMALNTNAYYTTRTTG